MSDSNFCRNCGARLTGKGWRRRMRGSLCEDCARRPGVSTRNRNLIAISLLAASAFAFGRYLRPSPPPLIIQRAANSPLSDSPLDLNTVVKGHGTNASVKADDTVYLCGARTKKGTPCRRRVQVAGERCFQHKGRTAMVPLEKLMIKDANDRK